MPGGSSFKKLLTTQIVGALSITKAVTLSDRELDLIDCVIENEIQTNKTIQDILSKRVDETLKKLEG